MVRNSKLAAWGHLLVISFIKGASSKWWNYRHFMHHGKPNVVRRRGLPRLLCCHGLVCSHRLVRRVAQINKDPDITLPYVFVLGTKLPQEYGAKKRAGFLPYNWQHIYFHIRALRASAVLVVGGRGPSCLPYADTVGPLALLPTYFHYDNLKFVIKRGYWTDIAFMLAFFARHHALYVPLFGWGGSWALYMLVRYVRPRGSVAAAP